MNSKQLFLALSSIGQATKNEVINWRLDGSANLFVQGIPILPNDLDIATNSVGFPKLAAALARFNPVSAINERANCKVLQLKIADVDIEIICYENELGMLGKTKAVEWSKMILPCLPLEDAKEFYTMINRPEKAELIENFLKK